MYKLKVYREFYDVETMEKYPYGAVIEISDEARLRNILNLGYAKLLAIRPNKKKRQGKKVIIFQRLLYCIGGIETWDYNLAKIFKDLNIIFVFQSYDLEQALRLGKYCDVIIDDQQQEYECDVFISANYDGGPAILPRTKAKKYYQTIHSDFSKLKELLVEFRNRVITFDERFDRIVSASETAKIGLKKAYDLDSVVVRNPLAKPDKKPLILVTLSRASEEKGIDKVLKMAKHFNETGRKFLWFIAATTSYNPTIDNELKSIKQIIQVEPTIYAQGLLHIADYLCQFSLTESYCYSMHEALQAGVPVLATKFEEAEKWIKDGKNGYLLEHDMSNFNEKWIDKVFNEIPTGFKHNEPLDPNWRKLLKGEL